MDKSNASPTRVAEKRPDPESKTEPMDGPLTESSTELTAPGESAIEDLVETLCRYRRANLQFPGVSKHDIAMTERSLRLFASAVSPELYTQSTLGYSYKQLDDDIRHLTKFFESTSWTNLTPAEQETLRSWTPKAKRYIESTAGKRLIFHAWIWHILDEKNLFGRSFDKVGCRGRESYGWLEATRSEHEPLPEYIPPFPPGAT